MRFKSLIHIARPYHSIDFRPKPCFGVGNSVGNHIGARFDSTLGKLTARQVQAAKSGTLIDGKGLLLRVQNENAKSWVLRVQYDGVRRDIGLGSLDILTLAEAREKAASLRKVALTGGDPIAERDKHKVKIPTFAEAVNLAHEELGKGWAEKTAEQFKASLETHANPILGKKRVDQIDTDHIIAALAPIWTEKPQIARKVRHRVMQVLSFSKAHRWRSEPVPLAKEITGGLAKQPESKGFRAMPYKELPPWMEAELAKDDAPARLALLFTIVTAARSGEARKARWDEIDLEDRLWHRPAEHMKAGRAHTVTLSDVAIEILERAADAFGDDGLIFPNSKGKMLSDASLGKLLAMSGRSETVHGFRSTFRDWAAEQMPQIPYAVAEMALAHSVGDKTERAYLRSDLRDLRRDLMDAWGAYSGG